MSKDLETSNFAKICPTSFTLNKVSFGARKHHQCHLIWTSCGFCHVTKPALVLPFPSRTDQYLSGSQYHAVSTGISFRDLLLITSRTFLQCQALLREQALHLLHRLPVLHLNRSPMKTISPSPYVKSQSDSTF